MMHREFERAKPELYSLRKRILVSSLIGGTAAIMTVLFIIAAVTYNYSTVQLKNSLKDCLYDIADKCGTGDMDLGYINEFSHNIRAAVYDSEMNLVFGDLPDKMNGIPFGTADITDVNMNGEHYLLLDLSVKGKDDNLYYIRGTASHTNFIMGLFFDSFECDLNGKYPRVIREAEEMSEICSAFTSLREISDSVLWYKHGIYYALYDKDMNLLAGKIPEKPVLPSAKEKNVVLVDEMFRDYMLYCQKITTVSSETAYLYACTEFAEFAGAVQMWMKIILIILPLLFVLFMISIVTLFDRIERPVRNIVHQANEIKDGNDLKARVVLQDGSKEINSLAATVNDMLQRLDQSFEQETRFTSDAAHELRNPLASMMLQSEYVLDEMQLSVEARKEVMKLHDKTEYLSQMVNALLVLERMEKNRHLLNLEELELNTLCSNLVEEERDRKNNKNISIEFVPEEKDAVITADVVLVIQAVSNLIRNAVNYGKENGYVKVSVIKENSMVKIVVEDNGCGISEENLKYIWNRFFRTNESRLTTQGFGLGLSLVRLAADLHNGTVNVESKLNEGSTFTLVFPEKPAFMKQKLESEAYRL